MRKRLIVIAAFALALSGCAASPSDVAEECGGDESGISVTSDGTIEYDQDHDVTKDAWQCLLGKLVPEKSDQYRIAMGLDEIGTSGDMETGGRTVVWGTSPTGTIRLFFNS